MCQNEVNPDKCCLTFFKTVKNQERSIYQKLMSSFFLDMGKDRLVHPVCLFFVDFVAQSSIFSFFFSFFPFLLVLTFASFLGAVRR